MIEHAQRGSDDSALHSCGKRKNRTHFWYKSLGNTSTASAQGIAIANKQPSEILLTRPSINLVLFKAARLARPLTFSHKAEENGSPETWTKNAKKLFCSSFLCGSIYNGSLYDDSKQVQEMA